MSDIPIIDMTGVMHDLACMNLQDRNSGAIDARPSGLCRNCGHHSISLTADGSCRKCAAAGQSGRARNTGDCVDCGEWSSRLRDGICPECRQHAARALGFGHDQAGPRPGSGRDPGPDPRPDLTRLCRDTISALGRYIHISNPDDVAEILDTALWTLARRIRAGHEVSVPNLGQFKRVAIGRVPDVVFLADADLSEPLPLTDTQPEA